MESLFHRFHLRARPLGKYAGKYVRAVERNGAGLVFRLEAAGALSRVHLDRCAPSLRDDFAEVAAAATSPAEAVRLLGTFYAVQFVHLNGRCLERLAADLSGSSDRRASYRVFLLRAEREFTGLVSTFVRQVLRFVLPTGVAGRAPWVLCAVGTRGHQDDIDVVAIDTGGAPRRALEQAFGRLTGEMLRHASALDHYIASSAGTERLCFSPEDLRDAIAERRLDFVSVTELLRAEPLAGSRRLFGRLQREVVEQFFYAPRRDNTQHEFYLRGILGEIRSLMLYPQPPASVNPKEDALRLIVALTTALRTEERIPAGRTRAILQTLGRRRPRLRPALGRLDDSLVFLETFRHLAHLLLGQEEDIAVEGLETRENLHLVASAMGYQDRGPVAAVDQLLVHYQEAVDGARNAAGPLLEEAAHHLARISRFSRWLRRKGASRSTSGLAVQMAEATRRFRGARFWDDVLEAMAAPGGGLPESLRASYRALAADARPEVAARFADWGRDAPYALLTVLPLLRSGPMPVDGPGSADLASDVTASFLERLGQDPEDIRALSRVFGFYPAIVNRFLLTLDGRRLERLRAVLDVPIANPEIAGERDRLRTFAGVHRDTSPYVRRVLARLTESHPSIVLALAEEGGLRTFSSGRLASAERAPAPARRKDLLGDFYDAEFLRLALATLRGAPVSLIRSEFFDLTELYLRDLFDACLREVEKETGARLHDRDRFGLYLTGGHAARRPFDEDYDMLALVDATAEAPRRLAERVVIRMNRQIARRGIIAQNRLAERFGRFVITIDELAGLLEGSEDDLFIDRHQLLGARLVVGGGTLEERLRDRVTEPLIFDRAEEFVRRIARELSERRRIQPDDGHPEWLNLKRMPGGLREIDLWMAAEAARHRICPNGEDRFALLAARDPAHSDAYESLRAADGFFVAVRTVHRVAIAASDTIQPDYLEAAAPLLGFDAGTDPRPGEALFDAVAKTARRARSTIDQLAGEPFPAGSRGSLASVHPLS